MERFGCCSSFIACSDAGKCLHFDDQEYAGCNYRRKLEAGVIYYGANAGKKLTAIESIGQAPGIRSNTIYLACFRGLFAVMCRNKNTFSYKLSNEQFDKVKTAFDGMGIPYRLDMSVYDEIYGTEIEDSSPANSRTVFMLDGEEFNVLNFNWYLIKNFYAEKICKAFRSKGIEARVELIGTHASQRSYRPQQQATLHIPKQAELPVQAQAENEPILQPTKAKFEQVSIFSMMGGVTALCVSSWKSY